MLNAITWAHELGFHNVQFEIDAKLIVDVVHSDSDDHREFGHIIERCCSLLHQADSYTISYVKRQANRVTHAMARKARFSTYPKFYYNMPSYLFIVMNDFYPIMAY